MMDGNPNWWGMFSPSLFPSQFPSSSSSSSLPINSFSDSRDQPQSWSQLLLGDEERYMNQNQSHFQAKRLENWEDQVLNPSPASSPTAPFVDNIVKQEFSNESNNFYSQRKSEEEILIQTGYCPPAAATASWSHMAVQVSSPASSCVSTLTTHQNNKFLNFSYNNKVDQKNNNQGLENPSECHSSATGGACKKARVHQPSSSQPPLKVRKEKLVDRITALHQIVSPFGKTDTASVLSEAIGYIRFLQGQIEALSSPYLGNTPKNIKNPQSALLNDSCLKRKFAIHNQENNMEKPLKDLRSRGLCLVPVSCTQVVGSDNNGADYWAPPYGTTGF